MKRCSRSQPELIIRMVSRCVMVMALIATMGCALSNELVTKSTAWLPSRDPTRMALVVTQTRMDENGSASHQGMLCRAYFFHEDDPVPIKAEGDLVFTAYDQSKQGENRAPEGLYEIASTDLPTHLRPDIVGDAYLFWLPYEPRQKTQMAVQGRLTLPNQQVVTSGVVKIEMLPTAMLMAPPPERPQLSQFLKKAATANETPPSTSAVATNPAATTASNQSVSPAAVQAMVK